MTPFALALAAIAALIALLALRSAGALRGRVEALEAGHRRLAAEAEDAELRARRLEQFLALLARGRTVDPEMIEEGRLYDEIAADDARRLIEDDPPDGLAVLDVRTEQEVSGGHIEGAIWIPIDQIDARSREVPKEGRVLVFCAAGGRSAAACDLLSGHGWGNVSNVIGGMSAYPGKTITGTP